MPTLDQVSAWFKHSVTILWARIVALSGVIMAIVVNVFSDPNVNSTLQSALQAKYLPYYVIAIGVITELARRRTA
jgi:hypothetical protein